MELVRGNAAVSDMNRDGLGREGGGRLFVNRRQRDWSRGLLSNRGQLNEYLVFQPSNYFTRILGERVVQLNDALHEVREESAELISSVGFGKVQAHYAEIDKRIEATREKMAVLIEYCNKGVEGRFKEGLEEMVLPEPGGQGEKSEKKEAAARAPDLSDAARMDGADVFSTLRERHFKQGILTELGRDQGCVAFLPLSFCGRFMGEIFYSLNDALRRLETQTSYFVLMADGKTQENYYRNLEEGLERTGRDLEAIWTCCQRKVA